MCESSPRTDTSSLSILVACDGMWNIAMLTSSICDEILRHKSLNEGRFCFSLQLKVLSIIEGRSSVQEYKITAHATSHRSDRSFWSDPLTMYTAQDSSQGMVPPTVGGYSNLNQRKEDSPSQACLEACLLDESRLCQVDSTNHHGQLSVTLTNACHKTFGGYGPWWVGLV